MSGTLTPAAPAPGLPHPTAGAANGPATSRVDISEHEAWQVNGWWGVLTVVVLGALAAFSAAHLQGALALPWGILVVLLTIGLGVAAGSITVVSPGQTKVVQFFGAYAGTTSRTGLLWLAPLTTRRSVSVRVRNFETARLKVNDAEGNPVEIAAIVVWQVSDTARATFAVEDVVDFVEVQAEAAVRHVARSYPYDAPEELESLRGSTDVISDELSREVADRIGVAGVEIVEVRISHLAYAPEIAQAMLQRQQAAAVVAARSRIVEGAVGMVQMALEQLGRAGVVELDEERKAAMVSNLLVVLCGEARPTPVVNTGTLYA